MLKDVKFLRYKPSHIAVAAFMLALNANLETAIARALEVDLLNHDHIQINSLFQEETIEIKIDQAETGSNSRGIFEDPIGRWAHDVEELTRLRRDNHVRKAYCALLHSLNKKEFDGKLVDETNANMIVPRLLAVGTDEEQE